MLKFVHFSAILLSAVILAPGLAHLASLSSKMTMDQGAYFNAQAAYRGWSLFAAPIAAVLFLDAWLAFSARGEGVRFYLFALASAAIIATLVIFFICVFPGNQATSNWTQAPENWRALRARWEYGHAASAVITFVSLMAVAAAAFVSTENYMWSRRA